MPSVSCPLRLAGHAVVEGTDVYLFLIGMMLLSELAREHGVFDWLSSVAVRSARGSATRLFTLVYTRRHRSSPSSCPTTPPPSSSPLPS
jgi:Na+/H+ antiporter NhaD/arsenite permease-like protein